MLLLSMLILDESLAYVCTYVCIYVHTYLSILERLATPTTEFVRTSSASEVHASSSSQIISHVTFRTLYRGNQNTCDTGDTL